MEREDRDVRRWREGRKRGCVERDHGDGDGKR